MAEPCDHVMIGNLPADLDEAGLKTNFEAYGNIKWCRLFNGKGGDGTKYAIVEFSTVEEATWLVENLDGNVPLGLETEVTVKYKPKGPAGAKGGGGGGGISPGKGGNRSSPYGGGGGKGGNIITTGMLQDAQSGKGAGAWHSMGAMKGMMKGAMMGNNGQPTSIQDLWKGLLRHKVLPGGTWANDERTVVVQGLPSDTTEFDLLKIFSPFGAVLPGGIRVTLNPDGTAKGTGMVNFADLESGQAAIETLNNCMMPDGRFLRVKQWSDYGKGKGKDGKNGGKEGGKNGGGKNGGAIRPAGGDGEAEG